MPIPFKQHATSVFLDKNHFSEVVVYRPKGGKPRSIRAQVDRQPFDAAAGGGNFNSAVFTVSVKNDATTGVYLAELNRDNDTLEMPERTSDRKDSIFKITRLIDQDPGMLTLEVR